MKTIAWCTLALVFFFLPLTLSPTHRKAPLAHEPIERVSGTHLSQPEQLKQPLESALVAATAQASRTPDTPVELTIPSIGLNSPIVPVGLTAQGAMDVPDGSTNNVGWWEGGTIPGDVGSAVLDAHVFAAFSKLHTVSVGSTIVVRMKSGATHRYVVEETTRYPLADVPRERLFNQKDATRLNLITCAGTLTDDRATYTQRLIVYARKTSS